MAFERFRLLSSHITSHSLRQMFANISTDVWIVQVQLYMARATFSALCLLMVELVPARMLTQHQSFNKFSFMGG